MSSHNYSRIAQTRANSYFHCVPIQKYKKYNTKHQPTVATMCLSPPTSIYTLASDLYNLKRQRRIVLRYASMIHTFSRSSYFIYIYTCLK